MDISVVVTEVSNVPAVTVIGDIVVAPSFIRYNNNFFRKVRSFREAGFALKMIKKQSNTLIAPEDMLEKGLLIFTGKKTVGHILVSKSWLDTAKVFHF